MKHKVKRMRGIFLSACCCSHCQPKGRISPISCSLVSIKPPIGVAGQLGHCPAARPWRSLRKKDGYSKIRLGDSSEGWVENQYITQDKPAKDSPAESGQQVAPLKPLLADIQVEVKQLKSQLEQARQQSANSSQKRIQALEQALQTAEEARQNSLSTGNPQTAYIQPRAWHIPLLLIGFISGIVFKNYRIAKRYGGLRM